MTRPDFPGHDHVATVPLAGPRRVVHQGADYHATGKIGRDRTTGIVTMEYADGTGRRLWAAAGVVVEVDS